MEYNVEQADINAFLNRVVKKSHINETIVHNDKEVEYKKELETIHELMDYYNIPNEKIPDGINIVKISASDRVKIFIKKIEESLNGKNT